MSEFHGHLTEEQLHILRDCGSGGPGVPRHDGAYRILRVFVPDGLPVYWKKIRRRRLLI